jgi:hypothetical protein
VDLEDLSKQILFLIDTAINSVFPAFEEKLSFQAMIVVTVDEKANQNFIPPLPCHN